MYLCVGMVLVKTICSIRVYLTFNLARNQHSPVALCFWILGYSIYLDLKKVLNLTIAIPFKNGLRAVFLYGFIF